MPKDSKPKSIREAMTAAGRAADTKLDTISRSVTKQEKDIADIKKMVRDIQKVLDKVAGQQKASATAKKTTAGQNTQKKKAAPKKRKKPAKKRKKQSESSLFPF